MIKFFSLNQSGSELPYRMIDRILDVIGIIMVIVLVGLSVFFYCTSDNMVPTGFYANGEPRDWGDKFIYLIQGGLGILLWLCCFFTARNPKFINLPIIIRKERAVVQNYWKCHFCRWMLLCLLGVFYFTAFALRCAELGIDDSWAWMGFSLSLVLVFIVIFIMCVRVYRSGRA
ncbi:hypothetical protein [uncultured Bacteroides sp.]|uniref:hypothetical protein n=1 Tax=uncultured Bacteroides sp. TaxID=162156 RepID=UPI002602FD11|nr:hypothetical protein [uncultured Bacteroides sp.]